MNFGERLKSARLSKNLTQTEFSKAVGVKPNTASNWEHNVSRPNINKLGKICAILDVTPEYLFGSNPSIDYGKIIGAFMTQPGIIDIIDKFTELPENDKEAIRQIILSLSKKS